MYCNNCGKPFMDVWRGHDTRTNKKVLSNCPHCKSCSVLNGSQFIENYETRAPNQHSNTILYKHIKQLYTKYCLTWKARYPSDVFVTTKEQANFHRHFLIHLAFSCGITFDEMAAALSVFNNTSSPKVYI